MAQASVLTDTEIRRVFRIIETTRHAERNRLAFILSIYSGLRVGEIAALTVSDVVTADGKVRREIKLGAHQTKGSKGRTVVLATRVRKEIEAYLKKNSVTHHHTGRLKKGKKQISPQSLRDEEVGQPRGIPWSLEPKPFSSLSSP